MILLVVSMFTYELKRHDKMAKVKEIPKYDTVMRRQHWILLFDPRDSSFLILVDSAFNKSDSIVIPDDTDTAKGIPL